MGITINARFVTTGAEKPLSPAVALGCVALFLFPFGAVGVISVLVGAKRAIDGNIHDAGALLLVGSVFTLVAGAGYTALFLGRRKLQEQEQLKARHPDQPWLWREARLRDHAGNALCLFRAGRNRREPPWRVA